MLVTRNFERLFLKTGAPFLKIDSCFVSLYLYVLNIMTKKASPKAAAVPPPKLLTVNKDTTPSLFINSPVRKALQRLVQNETLWTAPLLIILFASLIRWAVTLNPYSGSYDNVSDRWKRLLKVCVRHRI